MSRREDFLRVLEHREPENNILDLGGNPLSTMEGKSPGLLLKHLGYEEPEPEYPLFGKTRKVDERILRALDIDTRAVGTILTPADSLFEILSETEYVDEWGIRRTFNGMYWDNVNCPLRNTTLEDLKAFRWPNPESVDFALLEEYGKKAEHLYYNTDYVVCGEHPVYGIFELGCWMCGFDDFLMKMVLDPDYVRWFFEKVLEYQLRVIDIYYGRIGRYIHYTSSGDDFATQSNLFISRTMFDSLIKPYFKERIKRTRERTDAAFLHHSCGCVHDIIESLLDCGVEILNPIQPVNEKMSPALLKQEFGDRIVFHGGLDTQSVLPFGNRETVEKAVHGLMKVMTRSGGYIFAAAHNIQEDVPPENVVAMFDAARKFTR
ncbi:MAG: uroporphyrinogen decarboxylase family protein [Clostridia bacterium]